LFIEVISGAIKYEKGFEAVESVFSYDDLRDVPGKKSGAGPVATELHYSGFGTLIKHLFGNASVATVPLSGADAGAFEHTITPKTDPPIGLTIEEAIGDKAHVFAGCRVNGATLTMEADQQLHAELAILARDEDSVGAVSSPTFPAENPILFDQLQAFKFSGSPVDITSSEVSLANGLREDGRFVNSRHPRKFDREGRRELTGSFTTDYDSGIDSAYADFRAETFRDLEWQYTGGIVVGGGSVLFELKVAVPKIRLLGETPEIAEGVIPVTIGWKALKSASPLWTIFLRNDVATL
jgi:hypothetical protein